MASADVAAPLHLNEEAVELAAQLRKLSRLATVVALLTSPALIVFLYHTQGWPWWGAILGGLGGAICFRGAVDVVMRRVIPWPSLFAVDDKRAKEQDIVNRKRSWWWRKFYVRVAIILVIGYLIYLLGNWVGWSTLAQFGVYAITLPFFLLFNFVILFGPMMLIGITQMRGFEPGDADWGVRLEDVRGQAEAKEEVRKIVTLWQSGEHFEKAGGKRERGLLFHGPPGTGKTMLAKAIATSFNAPFITMPGSGFAQTFIGMDAVIVRFLARKAKKLARKWGGQCIVFIDEIDAVGMRRQALQEHMTIPEQIAAEQQFYGPMGAVNPSGDMVVETEAWREHMFRLRAPETRSPYPGWMRRVGNTLDQAVPGGMFGMGGQLGLNQLLVVMDGIDNPPAMRRFWTNLTNNLLNALFIVPQRIGRVPLRIKPPRPRKDQIYFVGATNVPLNNLDPALTRPGRMGRHVWFRTPTKDDRKDIFDLYLAKVAHDPALDEPKRRDEIARITSGYSPAMIDQVCSMALTYAHHDGRVSFDYGDLLQAMSVIESGASINVKYVEHETRAVAIHEAGHAAAAHAYRPEQESSRLSIRMRSGTLGHHQTFEKEERFTAWQHEMFNDLIHTLGAMAAEIVFYGENGGGVGGDLAHATALATSMVSYSGMGPRPVDLNGSTPKDEKAREEQTDQIAKRFEAIGLKLMNRSYSAQFQGDRDPTKRSNAAQLIGQAYVTAENFIRLNKDKVENVAEVLIEKGEIYGDELMALLDAQHFEKPEIDWTKEESWPATV
ncbi:MAG TPA: AAA family ATPase [Gaiellaceae bacterium]|nr:AAA family ATPase [Gaiellaceae bacterium]